MCKNYLHRVQNRKDTAVAYIMWSVTFGCALSTVCTASAVTTQLPGNNGYCGGKVVFIDTEVRYIFHFCYCYFYSSYKHVFTRTLCIL